MAIMVKEGKVKMKEPALVDQSPSKMLVNSQRLSQSFKVQVAVEVDNGVVPVPDGNLSRNGCQLLADHIGEIVQRSEER